MSGYVVVVMFEGTVMSEACFGMDKAGAEAFLSTTRELCERVGRGMTVEMIERA